LNSEPCGRLEGARPRTRSWQNPHFLAVNEEAGIRIWKLRFRLVI
jgi:hypothetical protein